MQEKKKVPGGYMTVEASLIMPLVLYICVSVIYIGFFQYDRCVMKQDAYRAALSGSSTYRDSNQEVYNAAYENLEKTGTQKYIATDCEQKITVQGTVIVSMKGKIQMPFRGIAALVGKTEWEIKEQAESKCINPVFFIRMCRQLEDKIKKQEDKEEGVEDATDRIYQQF